MAILYVDDGGSNTSPFDTWAKATPDLVTAMADGACVAGSTVYIGHNSIATYAAIVTYSNNGTPASPIIIISADNTSGEPPSTYTTGAIEDADGGAYDLKFADNCVVYGVTFKAGDDMQTTTADAAWEFHDCLLEFNGVAADNFLRVATLGASIHLFNTDLKFTHAEQGIRVSGQGVYFEWNGGSLLTTDLNVLLADSTGGGVADIRGVDLSIMNGGHIMDGHLTSTDEPLIVLVQGCKLHATPPAIVNELTPGIPWTNAKMINCYSSGVPYFDEHQFGGNIYLDTAEYLDATYDGTNGYSAKMVTNANASFHRPLRYKLCDIWCAANPTLTIHFTHDINGDNSDAQDDEIWLEIEHPDGTVGAYRLWDRTSKNTLLTAASDLTTEGDPGWNAGQGAYNSIAVTIGGGAAGIHTIWVCLARASETVYVDPKVDVT